MTRNNFYPRANAVLDVTFDGRNNPDPEGILVEAKPIEARVQFNGYSDPDTWDLTFDGRQLPFDPDVLRGAAVQIFLYESRNLEEVTDWNNPPDATLLGVVDKSRLTAGVNGMQVEMSGKDYTALLHEREWDPKERIPSGQTLSSTLEQILKAGLGSSTVMRLDFGGAPSLAGGIASSAVAAIQFDPIVGATKRSTKKKGLQVKPGKSYWDVMYEMAVAHGKIIFVDGVRVVVTTPEAFFAESGSSVPVAVYGANIRELSVERSLVKELAPQIVSSYRDYTTGELVTAKYPSKSVAPPTTGIGTEKDNIVRVLPPKGIQNKQALDEYVKAQYEMRARGESEYRFVTKYLEDLAGQSFLDLRAGKPVFIRFDAFDKETIRSLPIPKRIEHLRAMGYSPQVSEVVASSMESLQQFEQPYYTQKCELSYSNTSGLEVEVTATNYAYERRNVDAISGGVVQA